MCAYMERMQAYKLSASLPMLALGRSMHAASARACSHALSNSTTYTLFECTRSSCDVQHRAVVDVDTCIEQEVHSTHASKWSNVSKEQS